MILLVDNYDSFVFNLARYVERLGETTHVVRNDAIDVQGVRELRPDGLLLSPGPRAPRDAGCCLELVSALAGEVPMLGICLGHQVIGEALGGRIIRAPAPMHGRTSSIEHAGEGIFAGLPNPFTACRYHSLIVDEETLPATLRVTARTSDGLIMGLEHRDAPLWGVQFHPESILTEHGYVLLANFLARAGRPGAEVPPWSCERVPEPLDPRVLPSLPVTF